MIETLDRIKKALPKEGLFADKEFLLSPVPFAIDETFEKELQQLGHRLLVFQRACNELYQRSIKGKQPAWIAQYLDAGKPTELIELSRAKEFRDDVPSVIRPDLILTETGYVIAEIDSIPGGMGLTGWLNQIYAASGSKVIGGAEGMLDGFQSLLPKGGDIVISEESATYRPEMSWIARRLSERSSGLKWEVAGAETYEPQNGRKVYRFLEMFDLENIPGIARLIQAAREGSVRVTPPFKPYLEEKMWFALFWLRPLREFWRREVGEKYFLKLQEVIPYTWPLDPAPLPHNAVIPRLEIQDWHEAAKLSQKERDLLIKVSGFSPLAWGSRGVLVGSDLPQAQWQAEIETALTTFGQTPRILQRFHKGRLVDHPYWDNATEELTTMRGRVRLCPYFFVENEKANLRGVLVTIVPADKKLVHGMRDGILVPAALAS